MAKKTQVVVVCDRHRGDVEAEGSVEIVIDGERRKLDLCAERLAEARKALRPWMRAAGTTASRPSGRKRRTSVAKRPRRSSDSADVRAWAIKKGYDIPARGRISNAVRDAYTAAKK